MKKLWEGVLIGFAAGALVMLTITKMVNVQNGEPEQNIEKQQEEQNKEDFVNGEEIQDAVNNEAGGYYVSAHMQVPVNFTEQVLLYGYIEYGIRKYNEANGQTIIYSCNMEEDMLPFDTEFCMMDTDKQPYKTDLAKEITPELANNIYNFRLKEQNNTIYMSVDTYNMKIYIYDAIAQ